MIYKTTQNKGWTKVLGGGQAVSASVVLLLKTNAVMNHDWGKDISVVICDAIKLVKWRLQLSH
jgi:hypothetical protein